METQLDQHMEWLKEFSVRMDARRKRLSAVHEGTTAETVDDQSSKCNIQGATHGRPSESVISGSAKCHFATKGKDMHSHGEDGSLAGLSFNTAGGSQDLTTTLYRAAPATKRGSSTLCSGAAHMPWSFPPPGKQSGTGPYAESGGKLRRQDAAESTLPAPPDFAAMSSEEADMVLHEWSSRRCRKLAPTAQRQSSTGMPRLCSAEPFGKLAWAAADDKKDEIRTKHAQPRLAQSRDGSNKRQIADVSFCHDVAAFDEHIDMAANAPRHSDLESYAPQTFATSSAKVGARKAACDFATDRTSAPDADRGSQADVERWRARCEMLESQIAAARGQDRSAVPCIVQEGNGVRHPVAEQDVDATSGASQKFCPESTAHKPAWSHKARYEASATMQPIQRELQLLPFTSQQCPGAAVENQCRQQ